MVHPLHLCDRQLCREARCEHKAARSSDVFMSCQALSCGPARAFSAWRFHSHDACRTHTWPIDETVCPPGRPRDSFRSGMMPMPSKDLPPETWKAWWVVDSGAHWH